MKRMLPVLFCAVLALVAMSTASQAAQITYKGADYATGLNWQGTYGVAGTGGRAIYWDIVNGRPDYSALNDSSAGNPSYIGSFTFQNTGGGGGGSGTPISGDGGGAGTTGINYDLVLTESKSFQFVAFFYDETYGTRYSLAGTDVALQVRLIDPGADPSAADDWHDITVAELQNGVHLGWNVEALVGETITTEVVWVSGDGVGAAGFFLDDVQNIPEPATVGLVLFGLGSIFVRRRSRR